MSGFLNKEQILAAQDIEERELEVPEWGGKILLRGLTGDERDEFEASIMVGKGKSREMNFRKLRAKMVALSVVDPTTRQRMFDARDVNILGRKSAKALQRVFELTQELNGMTDEAVEEMVGNSENGLSDDSGSDLPLLSAVPSANSNEE